ncbi:MAG: hypothetical protein HN396_18225, partial [Gemmatimonadales bacterium]|nr:hypothetical protein [Gemmatimonadales bacterium]
MTGGITAAKREEWGLEQDHHLFFALRWEELLNSRTYDSWQVRTSNLSSCLQELLDGLRLARSSPQVFRGLMSVAEEALNLARSDIVVKKHFAPSTPLLEEFCKGVTDGGDPKHEKLQRLESLANILQGWLADYRARVEEELRVILDQEKPPENYKIGLNRLIMSLAVELSRIGYSIPYMRDGWAVLSDPDNGEIKERLDRFFARFSKHLREYVCYVPLRIPVRSLPESKLSGVEFLPPVRLHDELMCVSEEDAYEFTERHAN